MQKFTNRSVSGIFDRVSFCEQGMLDGLNALLIRDIGV